MNGRGAQEQLDHATPKGMVLKLNTEIQPSSRMAVMVEVGIARANQWGSSPRLMARDLIVLGPEVKAASTGLMRRRGAWRMDDKIFAARI